MLFKLEKTKSYIVKLVGFGKALKIGAQTIDKISNKN